MSRRSRRKRRRGQKSAAEEKVQFFRHLTSYVIVNAAMLAINALNGSIRNWLPVIIFWGIGLAFHYVKAFGLGSGGVGSKEWEKKILDDEKLDDFEDDEHLDLKEIKKEPRKNWKDEDLV